MARTMRAMVIRQFGGPEVFEEQEVPVPEPGPGELLVEVHASSVNPVDYKVRQRGGWRGIQPPAILGRDVAGVVVEVGPGVTQFRPGDQVYYTPPVMGPQPGTYAEYHVVRQELVAPKPANLSFIEAAVVPLAGVTAWDAVMVRAGVQPGETVLVHGGAGGVGHFAVQIAKAAGAFVFTTARAANMDFARSLGADRVIDYQSEDFVQVIQEETGGRGVDVVVDTVGGELLARSFPAARFQGRVATILGGPCDFNQAAIRNLTVHGVLLQATREKLERLRALIERGLLRPSVDRVFPLQQVGDAHRYLEAGGVRGKVALQVRP